MCCVYPTSLSTPQWCKLEEMAITCTDDRDPISCRSGTRRGKRQDTKIDRCASSSLPAGEGRLSRKIEAEKGDDRRWLECLRLVRNPGRASDAAAVNQSKILGIKAWEAGKVTWGELRVSTMAARDAGLAELDALQVWFKCGCGVSRKQ